MLQRMYKRYGKSKQFYWWLSSYAVIMVLAILVNMIGYMVTLQVLEKEIEKNNQNALNNIQIVCDNFYSELISASYGLLQSSSVQQFSRDNLSDYERQTYARNVLRDMGSIVPRNQSVESCAVILRSNDLCIQNTLGITGVDMAYDTYFNGFYESKEAWMESVFSVSGMEFQSMMPNGSYVPEDAGQKKGAERNAQVFLVYRIPNVKSQLAVIVKINNQQLTKMLTSAQRGEEQAFVVDENGDILFQGADSMEVRSLKGIEGGMHNLGGTEYMVNVVQSGVTPFRYVRIVDSKLYLREVKQVRLSFVLGYLMCVLLAGALAWWFAELSDRQKRRMDKELQEQRKYLRKNILKQLLTGQIKGECDMPEKYLDMLAAKHFVVVLFDVLPLKVEDALKEEAPYNYDVLAKYLAIRFVGEGTEENAYFCVINEMCAGLLKLTEAVPDIDGIQRKTEQICLELSEELHIDMRCAISRVVDKGENLAEAYDQALEVINLRFLGEDKTVYVYDDVLQNYPKYSFNLELEARLIDTLMLGDYKRAEEIIKQQFDVNGRGSQMSLGALRVMAAEMVSTMLKAAAQIDMDSTVDCKQLYLVPMQMHNYHQIYEMQSIILQFAEKLCSISGTTTPDQKEKKCANVVVYIQEHYADPMLNVNMLVDVFRVSRSWLSKNFREEEGVRLSDYIVKYRLEKAKELLKTDMSVAQIAAATGFSSEVVYYRAFKKYENITSMQYRQLIQKQGKEKQADEEENKR